MTGAMYAAVSGLKTHMSALNVIGNNISNVNTQAYKATRYTFSEALYTTTRSGSDGTETTGGVNPAQIGYGCSIGTIDLDMSTKTFTPTGLQMDCMIDGDGFFLVGDKTKTGVTNDMDLQGMMLTRLGNFEEKGGYIVDGDGQVVYGFLNVQRNTEGPYNPNATDGSQTLTLAPVLTPLRLPYAEVTTDPATGKATTRLYFPTVEAPADGATGGSTVEDNKPTDAGGGAGGGAAGGTGDEEEETAKRVHLVNMAIDKTGRITGMTADEQQVIIGYVAVGQVDSPNGVTHVDGRYYQSLGGAGNLHLTTVGGTLNFIPTAEGTSTVDGLTINSNLTVEGSGDTELINGGLEGSGTDLANEISNMIMIQRGYQANTRIVTVTDSMLEELVNMKR